MMNVYVLRYPPTIHGVFGTMFNNFRMPFAVTLENVDTLIPASIYECFRDRYHAGGYDTFLVDVPNRTRILLHKLNWARQSAGCIGIGEAFKELYDEKVNQIKPAIGDSDEGFKEFWRLYETQSKITLQIHEVAWPLY